MIVNNIGVNSSVQMPHSLRTAQSGLAHYGEAPVIVHNFGNSGTSNKRKIASSYHSFQNHITSTPQQEQYSLEVLAIEASSDAERGDHNGHYNETICISGYITLLPVPAEGMVYV